MTLPTRVAVERALRSVGLSARQARRFVAVGWPTVVGEAQAETDALRDQLERLTAIVDNDRGLNYDRRDLLRCGTHGEARSEAASGARNVQSANQQPDERGLAVPQISSEPQASPSTESEVSKNVS